MAELGVAHMLVAPIVRIVSSIRNPLVIIAASFLVALSAGCGGVNTTHSVSPATFFLPGLMQVTPTKTEPLASAPASEAPVTLAHAN